MTKEGGGMGYFTFIRLYLLSYCGNLGKLTQCDLTIYGTSSIRGKDHRK